jgi:serine/threonine-protein kinase HSL1, negative regulator of Swe1 kinase
MNSKASSRGHSSRAPLGDATDRAINTSARHGRKSSQSRNAEINPLRAHPAATNGTREKSRSTHRGTMASNHASASAAPPASRVTTDAKATEEEEKRFSQVSTSSGASSGKRKTHIGPWQLGRTLGKGSAGRVRLARHHLTQQQVAVKILPKHSQNMTQAGSLADIDKWDRKQPEFTLEKRMPLSIEREVAILKLIDHPNIMKLYDIWENRSEMYATPFNPNQLLR